MRYRQAIIADVPFPAPLNRELIVDEGHRDATSLSDLERWMARWLADGYAAVLFEEDAGPAGYALYRREPDHVYLRRFYICPDRRRSGIGRAAMAWLRLNAWAGAPRIRVDLLIGNEPAMAFWRSVGFNAYCLTMERDNPIPADSPAAGPI